MSLKLGSGSIFLLTASSPLWTHQSGLAPTTTWSQAVWCWFQGALLSAHVPSGALHENQIWTQGMRMVAFSLL